MGGGCRGGEKLGPGTAVLASAPAPVLRALNEPLWPDVPPPLLLLLEEEVKKEAALVGGAVK